METPDEELQGKYRAVFLNSQLGRDVLEDILRVCHFGRSLDPDNTVQVSEYNVGLMILFKCGVFDWGRGTFPDVVRALSSVQPFPWEKEISTL